VQHNDLTSDNKLNVRNALIMHTSFRSSADLLPSCEQR